MLRDTSLKSTIGTEYEWVVNPSTKKLFLIHPLCGALGFFDEFCDEIVITRQFDVTVKESLRDLELFKTLKGKWNLYKYCLTQNLLKAPALYKELSSTIIEKANDVKTLQYELSVLESNIDGEEVGFRYKYDLRGTK